MKLQTTYHYLKKVVSDAHHKQYQNLDGSGKRPRFFFTFPQFVILAFSIFYSFRTVNGFDRELVGYIIQSLSILIGIFLAFIISSFETWYSNLKDPIKRDDLYSESIKKESQRQKASDFCEQFWSLTSYSVVIGVLIIVILSLVFLVKTEMDFFFNSQIVLDNFQNEIPRFSWILQVLLIRILAYYFISNFLLLTVYSVSSFYAMIMHIKDMNHSK